VASTDLFDLQRISVSGDASVLSSGRAIPAARIVCGTVYALDIEPAMVQATRAKAEAEGLRNVQVSLRDFVADGSGLAASSVDCAMLFNILHAESPHALLQEAYRILVPHGLLSIVHWNYDPATPRGPSMEIRPRLEQCRDWIIKEGFRPIDQGVIQLPPHTHQVKRSEQSYPTKRSRCTEKDHPQITQTSADSGRRILGNLRKSAPSADRILNLMPMGVIQLPPCHYGKFCKGRSKELHKFYPAPRVGRESRFSPLVLQPSR
jgi:SAM-dependent methyltransferase